MSRRRRFDDVIALPLRSWAFAACVGLGLCAPACGGESGSDEYFRGSIDYGDFAADPNVAGTYGYCNAAGTFAMLLGTNADGDAITVTLNTCAPGSYALIPGGSDPTAGAYECDYEPASPSTWLYSGRGAEGSGSCEVVIERFDTLVVGSMHAVLPGHDFLMGDSLDPVEVSATFYLVVDPP